LSPRFAVAPPRTAAGGAGLVVLGAFFVQWAATMAVPAIGEIGGLAVSGWRFLFGATVLVAVVRPKIRRWTSVQWREVAFLGIATAGMNLCFYQSIGRIHLGTAVAIEYMGPFLVAALGQRTWRHFGFVAMAALGVLALARPGSGLTLAGFLFAAGSGVGWAAYTFASHRVGRVTSGFDGLAVAMAVSCTCTFVFILPSLSHVVSTPGLLGRFLAMAVLSTVIGFACEMQALRRLPPSDVGVLLALNPAVAFFVGWLFLGQSVHPLDLVGMVLVVVAGVAVTRDASEGYPAPSVG
jgi:inner membrane transporter RhtA